MCQTHHISTIFKTLNSDIDTMSSKWGMFGISFSDMANAISAKWKNVNNYISLTNDATLSGIADAWKDGNPINFLDETTVKEKLLEYNKAFDNGSEALASFLDKGTNNDFLDDFFKNFNNNAATMSNYNDAVKSAQAAHNGLTFSMVASKVAAIALNAALSMGISIAISALCSVIDNLIHKNENAIKSARELSDNYNDFKKTNSSNISTLKGLKTEFDELSKGVSQYGKNISLTSEEYERYKEIIQQIVDISPSLTEGYNTENGYLVDKNRLIERAIELQKQERQNELGKMTNLEQLDVAMSGHIAEYSKALDGKVLSNNGNVLYGNKFSSFKDSLYDLYNTDRVNFSSTDMAKQIMSLLGVEDVEKEIQKYFNDNGTWSESSFWDDYVEKIAKNINVITKSLSSEDVKLDDSQFDIFTQKATSCAQTYLDMKDSISAANNSIQTELNNIAEYADGFSSLSAEQQIFVSEYLKGFNIEDISSKTSRGSLEYDEDKMAFVKNQIIEFIEQLSGNSSTKEALINLYAPPTDNESIEEYLRRFNEAYKVIKSFCEENSIKIPVVFTSKKDAVDNLSEEYNKDPQNAVTYFNDLKQQGVPNNSEQYGNESTNSTLDGLSKATGNINTLKNSLATLYSGNYSSEELINSIKDINSAVAGMGKSLNWEFIEEQPDSLEVLGNALEYISEKYADSILADSNIGSDSKFGTMIKDLIADSIKAQAEFDGLTAQIDGLQSSYGIVSNAIAEYNENGSLSLDTLQSLLTADENYIAMLEVKNGQLVINEDSYRELVAMQLLEYRTKLENAAAAEIEALAKSKSKNATNENADASQTAVEKINSETQALNENTSAVIAKSIAEAQKDGATDEEIQGILTKYNDMFNTSVDSMMSSLASFMTGSKKAGASAAKAAGAASKEAADATVTAFEEQYKKLKDIRDRDKINEKQYLDTLRAMNERYFKGNEKYIDEYNKYQKEYLDGMRDLYESVISDVAKQIDKQIDSLNDQKDAAVDSLKSQQEAAKEALEAQKDAIEEQIKLIDKQIDSKQAQIDAINEENEARENAINLEKEQYELERLRNQRTEYVYSGKDKGFIYQTDTGAIRDQEQAVKEAEDQIRIADIEKEISLLEKKKEVLEEQQDAISEQIDRVDEYYEQLIANTESYWDAQIDGAEETKSRWEELQELQEEMEMNARLLSIGISQEDIENLSNDELLERVREKYLGILSDIYAGNKEMLSSLSDLTGIDVSALPSFLQDTQGYMDILSQGVDFANLNDSLGIVIDQFANVAAAAGQMTGSVIGSTGIHLGTNTDTKTSAGTGDVSFIDAVKQLEDESVPVINNVADAFAGEESSEDSSQSIVGSVNKAKAAIAGSSSGKKDSSEGSEGNGEDSGSLLEAMAAQSQAALDEETGIPAQIQKWQELNNVLSAILSNLMNIAAVISTMNATETSINSGSPLGPALAKGGVSHGTRNAMVSEYNQMETIIHKNGTYEITSSPTLTDLSPGDQVLNNSQTLALIRKKREASARGTNGVFLGDTHSVLSSVPELQLHNTILDNSLASMTSMQLLGNDNKNSLINVSIGDVILENVQNADTLSKQIVMRLPTQIKQELSKRG